MNARWNEHRRRQEAPQKAVATPKPDRQKRQKACPAGERFPCRHRSAARIGRLDCNCHNKPDVFDCAVHEFCILLPSPRPSDGRGGIVYTAQTIRELGPSPAGARIPWERDEPDRQPVGQLARIAVCELCGDRKAAEATETAPESTPAPEPIKPPGPFALAPEATAAARVVICRACDKREACGKSEAAARWALEACPDGRWRAEA
jgi:hypothetical protein